MTLWIQVSTDCERNRKTYQLADELSHSAADLMGVYPHEVWRARAVALLVSFWGYVAELHPDGDVTDANMHSLSDTVRWAINDTAWAREDVRQLLVRTGHIDRTKRGRLKVHDWHEFTGFTLERRQKERRRKRLERRGLHRNGRGPSADAGADTAQDGPLLSSSPVLSSPDHSSKSKSKSSARRRDADTTPWDYYVAQGWQGKIQPAKARDWFALAGFPGANVPESGYANVQAFLKSLERRQRSTKVTP